MMDKNEALNPIRTLRKRLEEIAESLDTEVEQFVLIPATDDRPDLFQVVFFVRADAMKNEAEKEQAKFDAQFAQIEKGLTQTALDKKVEDIKSNRDAVKDLFDFDD
jgi:type VI protein secretion system component VasK